MRRRPERQMSFRRAKFAEHVPGDARELTQQEVEEALSQPRRRPRTSKWTQHLIKILDLVPGDGGYFLRPTHAPDWDLVRRERELERFRQALERQLTVHVRPHSSHSYSVRKYDDGLLVMAVRPEYTQRPGVRDGTQAKDRR